MKVMTWLLVAMLALPAAAQEDDNEALQEVRRYMVELVVFRYNEEVALGTEIFPPDEPVVGGDEIFFDPADPNQDALADDMATPESPFVADDTVLEEETDLRRLAPVLTLEEEFTMQDIVDKLVRLDVYDPILHVGWTQAPVPEADSRPLELTYFGKPPAGLDGHFMLYLGRYLHLVVDLALDADPSTREAARGTDEPFFVFGDARPSHDDYASRSGRVRYRIHEDRIFKHGDIRYFDHPKFGVIAKIVRVEAPEDEEDPDAETEDLLGAFLE